MATYVNYNSEFVDCLPRKFIQIAPLMLLSHMMTSSNGNIFRVTGPLCGEFTGPRWIPHTKASDVFFDLRLNKRLSKQPWGCWFETPSWLLWRQCSELYNHELILSILVKSLHTRCLSNIRYDNLDTYGGHYSVWWELLSVNYNFRVWIGTYIACYQNFSVV